MEGGHDFMEQILKCATTASKIASSIIMQSFKKVTVEYKDINNLVTKADLDSEKAITECIKNEFPTHDILGEEFTSNASLMSENLWIIDPLDGTNNYSNDIPHFSISIAFAQKGNVKMGLIYDPCRDECFTAISGTGSYLNGEQIHVSPKSEISHAMVATGFYYDRSEIMEKTLNTIHSLFIYKIRGIRRMGSAALDLAWTSCGRYDAYFEYFLSPWDFAAGMLILEEAGGICCNKYGGEISMESEGIIATNKNLHDELTSYIQIKK